MAQMERRRLKRPDSTSDNFLQQADPTLIEALMGEVRDQIALIKGQIQSEVVPQEPHALTHAEWPTRSYTMVQRWRHRMMEQFLKDPTLVDKLYGNNPIKFICHWLDIYEPRNAGKDLPTRFPFVLFKRQEELIQFYHACVISEGNGLVEKSRDMGATWCGVGYSVWMWRFIPGSAIGWGSATAEKLDRLGDANSIFEKIRLCIRGMPPIFKPPKLKEEHLMHKRIVNPNNGSTITGDIGDNIGRGGRTRLYFVDEAAYLERADAVEGSLSENTRVRIDISSVSSPGTVFHRTRQAGVEWSPGRPILKDRHNVFLMDWRDHPEKTEEWARTRKKSFEERGLAHVYAREIERNYAATTEGALIKPEWVDASFDAHKKLDLELDMSGPSIGGLDVADGGEAANGFTRREGQIVKLLKIWQVRDTAITARHAVTFMSKNLPGDLFYDCIGVGSGVKAECNRLADVGLWPKGLELTPWNASDSVLRPTENVVLNDPKSPINRLFFANLKAQAWWHVQTLFYNTYRAVVEGQAGFKPHELISIDTTTTELAMRHRLRDELCQVMATTANASMKMSIKKADHDRQSPNLADSLVICLWPVPKESYGMITSFVAPIVITG